MANETLTCGDEPASYPIIHFLFPPRRLNVCFDVASSRPTEFYFPTMTLATSNSKHVNRNHENSYRLSPIIPAWFILRSNRRCLIKLFNYSKHNRTARVKVSCLLSFSWPLTNFVFYFKIAFVRRKTNFGLLGWRRFVAGGSWRARSLRFGLDERYSAIWFFATVFSRQKLRRSP